LPSRAGAAAGALGEVRTKNRVLSGWALGTMLQPASKRRRGGKKRRRDDMVLPLSRPPRDQGVGVAFEEIGQALDRVGRGGEMVQGLVGVVAQVLLRTDEAAEGEGGGVELLQRLLRAEERGLQVLAVGVDLGIDVPQRLVQVGQGGAQA